MNVKIQYFPSNPYKMDMIIKEKNNIAALTEKNAQFIEAVVSLDSNYRRESMIVEPDDGFDIESHSINSEGKYCGSTKYWFNRMESNPNEYELCIQGAVISIDRSNPTHLETTNNGRKLMAERIIKKCPNIDTLRNELEVTFTADNENHLIAYMINPNVAPSLKSIKDNNDMFYLSFASKFCSYAAEWLETKKQYSKYDNVVAKGLPEYIMAYLGKRVGKTRFQVNNGLLTSTEKYQNRLKTYEDYCYNIDAILETLANDGISITKNELDHIIWYGMKGN